ncbi:MAG: hypothetical protein AAF530_13630 [Pseudomonadota bacterium]
MTVDKRIEELRKELGGMKEVLDLLEAGRIRSSFGAHWTEEGQQEAIGRQKGMIDQFERTIDFLEKRRDQLSE